MTGTKTTKTRVDWRQRRGETTRNQILNATVRCIVEHGYGALTTTMIADAAQVSRGAMLHHFPSKEIIVHETIRYLFKRRVYAFEKMVEAIPRDNQRVHNSIEAFWKQVNHPYFIAFFELTVAARTDKGLLDALAPCLKALEERGLELAHTLFPEVDRDRLMLGMALSQGVIEHLALQHFQQDRGAADERLIRYLEQQINLLYSPDQTRKALPA